MRNKNPIPVKAKNPVSEAPGFISVIETGIFFVAGAAYVTGYLLVQFTIFYKRNKKYL